MKWKKLVCEIRSLGWIVTGRGSFDGHRYAWTRDGLGRCQTCDYTKQLPPDLQALLGELDLLSTHKENR